jgi:CDP-diacylglycerol---serine O-phosphatidyltransferase
MKSAIPNTLTLTNLFCGCLCLICIFNKEITLLPLFFGLALLMDYIDGFVARALKVSSDLGKELDSLADMVSFGLVPGALFYFIINKTLHIERADFNDLATLWGLWGFVVTLFSCLRLAKFNLDDRQADSFIGLNTPSCTTFVLGLTLCINDNIYNLDAYLQNFYLLVGLTFIFSYLLISEIPMFSFKFKSLDWKTNRFRFGFIVWVLGSLFILPLGFAMAAIILSYIFFSVILWLAGYISIPKRQKNQ